MLTDAEFEVIKIFAARAGEDIAELDQAMLRRYLIQIRLQTKIADHTVEERFAQWLDSRDGKSG